MSKKILTILLIVLFTGCITNEDESKVTIYYKIPTEKLYWGDKIEIQIEATTKNQYLKKFTVHSFDTQYGKITLKDTIPDKKTLKYTHIYTIPPFNKDSINIKFLFEAIDDENNIQQNSCELTVFSQSTVLSEKTGYSMYSAKSGKPDTFSLKNLQTIFYAIADSALTDIYNYDNPEILNEDMSREWRSRTNICFIKNNSFNYMEATDISVKSTYLNSVKQPVVKNLSNDDIILIGREKAYGVIKIINIYDEPGSDNDRILFNLKIISE